MQVRPEMQGLQRQMRAKAIVVTDRQRAEIILWRTDDMT